MIDYSISTAQNHGFQQIARTMRLLKPAVVAPRQARRILQGESPCREGDQ
jgi:hypothetical protein